MDIATPAPARNAGAQPPVECRRLQSDPAEVAAHLRTYIAGHLAERATCEHRLRVVLDLIDSLTHVADGLTDRMFWLDLLTGRLDLDAARYDADAAREVRQ